MIKVQILTATTPEALEDDMSHWTHDGWHLHEGIVITAQEAVWSVNAEGHTVVRTETCGFLQVLTKTEGTCKAPQEASESV